MAMRRTQVPRRGEATKVHTGALRRAEVGLSQSWQVEISGSKRPEDPFASARQHAVRRPQIRELAATAVS